jgi:hypothetical protein
MGNLSIKHGNLFDIAIIKEPDRKEIADMFKIVQFPEKIKPFFDSLNNQFHWNHFEYFRTLVLLIAFAWGRRTIANLYRWLDSSRQPHRSRFNNFINLHRWNPAIVLQLKAHDLLALLGLKRGDCIEMPLDDSKKHKRGKAMQGVCWLYDHVTGRNIPGHQYVVAVLQFRGYTIPFGIRLYLKKEDCQALKRPFRKTTQLAAELIRQFNPPEGVRVRVLFDSYYLCPVVVKACLEKGFHFVSSLKSNRNLFKSGQKLKAGRYGYNLFRRGSRKTCQLRKSHGTVKFCYMDAGWLQVSRVGRAHVLFSRKNAERKILALVTDDPTLSSRGIIHAYDHRWRIEVFFKDSKQLLGLGQYQNLSIEAAVSHLHLVCMAYALLTHIAIEGDCAKGKRSSERKLSIAELQDELRRMVWEDLADHLKGLASGTQVVKELGRLLVAA